MCDWCQVPDCPYYSPGSSCYYDSGEDYRSEGMGEFDFEDYQDYY